MDLKSLLLSNRLHKRHPLFKADERTQRLCTTLYQAGVLGPKGMMDNINIKPTSSSRQEEAEATPLAARSRLNGESVLSSFKTLFYWERRGEWWERWRWGDENQDLIKTIRALPSSQSMLPTESQTIPSQKSCTYFPEFKIYFFKAKSKPKTHTSPEGFSLIG